MPRHAIDWSDPAAAGKEAGGAWQHYDSFSWWGRPDKVDDHPDHWALVHWSGRDSDLLEQSNAAALEEDLLRFAKDCHGADGLPDVWPETASHWACGYVEGVALRVFDDTGTVTPVWARYCELMDFLEGYPVLDEEDYSRREYEATLENIREQVRIRPGDWQLPADWERAVWQWLWDHEQRELDNVDGRGAWPSQESVVRAFRALGYANHDDPVDVPNCDPVLGDPVALRLGGELRCQGCNDPEFGESAEPVYVRRGVARCACCNKELRSGYPWADRVELEPVPVERK